MLPNKDYLNLYYYILSHVLITTSIYINWTKSCILYGLSGPKIQHNTYMLVFPSNGCCKEYQLLYTTFDSYNLHIHVAEAEPFFLKVSLCIFNFHLGSYEIL